MPLTPQDVANKQFKKVYRRGYHEGEVDDFLDAVEAEIARLLTENNDLRQRVQTLQQQLSAAAAPRSDAEPQPAAAAPEQPTPEPPEQAALRTLQLAQRTADQTVAEARAEAEKTVADARARATALERESQQRHQQTVAELERRRSDLQSRIEDLRVFEREYRTRLRAYLETQLRDLDSAREAEPARAPGGAPSVATPSGTGGGFTQRPQSTTTSGQLSNPFAAVYGGGEPVAPPREPGYADATGRPADQVEVDDEGPEPTGG